MNDLVALVNHLAPGIAFAGAWIVPLLLVEHYRRYRVPNRWLEIERALFKETQDESQRLPAEHYVSLFDTMAVEPPKAGSEGGSGRKHPLPEAELAVLKSTVKAKFDAYHRTREYVWPMLLLAASSGGALWLIYCWVTRNPTGLPYRYDVETVLAIAGAYVWSLYEILNRRTSCDLTPDDLYSIAVRFLVAIPVGRVASVFADGSAKAAFAFAATAFPIKELLRFMRRRTLKKVGEESPAGNFGRESLLTACVDGIDVATVTRLEELQITTYTNLAYADPIRIMAQTGYSLRMIVQWMDHALLCVYAAPYKKKLKLAGMPCSLDVKEFYETHFAYRVPRDPPAWVNRAGTRCEAVKALEKKLGLDAALIREMFQRVAVDPHVLFLDTLWYTGYVWRERPQPPACSQHPEPGWRDRDAKSEPTILDVFGAPVHVTREMTAHAAARRTPGEADDSRRNPLP
jgi:hypothetical protein